MNLTDEQCLVISRGTYTAVFSAGYLEFVVAGLSPREGVFCAGGCGMMIKVGPDFYAEGFSMMLIPELDNMALCHRCYTTARTAGQVLTYRKVGLQWL